MTGNENGAGQFPESRESLLGKYLANWIADLRAGKTPTVTKECLRDLTLEEISELLAMARFTKALQFPSTNIEGVPGRILVQVQAQLSETSNSLINQGRVLAVSSRDFAQCLRAARERLGLKVGELSRETLVAQELLSDVETNRRSPVRIPIDRMLAVLQRLYLAVGETVDLIEKSAEEWTKENFSQAQTQLGRIDKGVGLTERRELLGDVDPGQLESDIQREIIRVKEYASLLRQRIKP